jgi:hypothetical protein
VTEWEVSDGAEQHTHLALGILRHFHTFCYTLAFIDWKAFTQIPTDWKIIGEQPESRTE